MTIAEKHAALIALLRDPDVTVVVFDPYRKPTATLIALDPATLCINGKAVQCSVEYYEDAGPYKAD